MAKGMTVHALSVILASGLLCSGCSSAVNGRFGILSGVLAWARQDWVVSASSFLGTADAADSALGDYAIFGLAATYIAQNEYDSALARLSTIRDSPLPEIRAGVWYQAGVIAYRRGQFGDAVEYFKKSLENDSSAVDAKINLELSRRSLVEDDARRSGGASGVNENQSLDQEAETIFNLVRKKEQDRWKNEANGADEPTAADY